MKALVLSAIGVLCVAAGCKVSVDDDDDNGGEGGESGETGGRGGAAGSAGTAGSGATSGGYAGLGGSGEGGEGGDPYPAGGQAGEGGADSGGEGGADSGGEGGGAAGETASAGAGGDGSQQIDEGEPGTIGNRCTEQGACEANLECATSLYCQPSLSDLPDAIVQAVPPPDTANIPAYAPIMLFADSTYSGVTFTVAAHTTKGVEDITDEVAVASLTSGADKDVYVLAPKLGYPLGASIVVTISGPWDGTVVFNVDHESPAYAEGALDFDTSPNSAVECGGVNGSDSLPVGWTGFGDFGVIPATGSIVPTSPASALALSTGNFLCGEALEQTSSLVVSGPIRGFGNSPSFVFDYNFQSTEFDDFCESQFDDTLLAVLSGPNGAVATMIDSVNVVCERNDHEAATFAGMPDAGDGIYKQTGNTAFTLQGAVGSPAVLSFVVTDVSDEIYSTLVSIDSIRSP